MLHLKFSFTLGFKRLKRSASPLQSIRTDHNFETGRKTSLLHPESIDLKN